MNRFKFFEESATEGKATLRACGWRVAPAVRPLPARMRLSASVGDLEGQCALSWKPVAGSRLYLVEWAKNPAGAWTQCYAGTKSSCWAGGLEPGDLYYFRVRAVGAGGLSPWSDLAQKRAG